MEIRDIEQQIIEEFSTFDDWMDKYNYLIELGKEVSGVDKKYKTDQYRIDGCQSQVWLQPSFEDGKLFFRAESDAMITKGLVHLLVRVLSGQKPDEIINAELPFIDEIGLKSHLSPTRSNGLLSMVRQMKLYAAVFKAKSQND